MRHAPFPSSAARLRVSGRPTPKYGTEVRHNGTVTSFDYVRTQLPHRWSVARPGGADVGDLTELLRRHEQTAKGSPSTSVEAIEADVTGKNAEACDHVMVRDSGGFARGWASAHDRAAGRVLGAVTIDTELDDEAADVLAASLYQWTKQAAVEIGSGRGLTQTQLDSGAFADDKRQQRWLQSAGLERVRTWWQMSRPVTPAEGEDGGLPSARDEVVIRLVRRGEDGLPNESDLRVVHTVLEAAFADHFNSHRESFQEFVFRLRADPGHRWDHWWIAEVADEDAGEDPSIAATLPTGALVGTVSGGGDAPASTYVAYIGVLQSARGHGAAKALLNAVIADAAKRGRSQVDLEVDADSPTGADGLYLSMGFVTRYTTQSWHTYLDVPAQPTP